MANQKCEDCNKIKNPIAKGKSSTCTTCEYYQPKQAKPEVHCNMPCNHENEADGCRKTGDCFYSKPEATLEDIIANIIREGRNKSASDVTESIISAIREAGWQPPKEG